MNILYVTCAGGYYSSTFEADGRSWNGKSSFALEHVIAWGRRRGFTIRLSEEAQQQELNDIELKIAQMYKELCIPYFANGEDKLPLTE